MNGIFIATGEDGTVLKPAVLTTLNKITNEWTMRAARGECEWVCSSCCVSFEKGMPDACPHKDEGCTAIIQRDKKEANGNRN